MAENLNEIKDYYKEVSEQVTSLEQQFNNSLLNPLDAISKLLVLEKKTRLGNDVKSSTLIAQTILSICMKNDDWKLLEEHIVLLCKRHAQLKQVISAIIKTSLDFCETRKPSLEIRTNLIATMREISKGKMYVELEYAHMSRIYAKIKEDKGDITTASKIMQELQVEILGSMDIKEKTEYILEQLRLTLDTNDQVRAELVSKKIDQEKLKNDARFESLKLCYYNLMVRYHLKSESYLDVCRCYLEIYRTILANKAGEFKENEWKEPFKKSIIYIAIAKFDNEVCDLRHRILTDKNLSKDSYLNDFMKKLLEVLTTDRLVAQPLEFEGSKTSDSLRQEQVFQDSVNGEKHWNALKTSIVQHNIRVLAKYYNKICLKRMSDLLKLKIEQTEKYIAEMIHSEQIFALIDRPNKIVKFKPSQNADDILNKWTDDISSMLSKVDKVCYLISKENMVHGIASR